MEFSWTVSHDMDLVRFWGWTTAWYGKYHTFWLAQLSLLTFLALPSLTRSSIKSLHFLCKTGSLWRRFFSGFSLSLACNLLFIRSDQTQQVQFLRGLSKSVLNKYAGERIVLGGDLNCVMNKIDKCRGRSFEQKKMVIKGMKTLMRIHNLIDTWSCKHPNKQPFT